MDNTFYKRNPDRKRRKNNEKQKNAMTKVIVVQLVLSLAISGILFAVCKTDSNLSQNIKLFYTEISKTDIAVSRIFGVFKNVVKETFAPTLQSGETNGSNTGEEEVFSPVFLTVKLKNPLNDGNVSSHFGYRVSPITKKYSLHTGLDVATTENSEIYAAYDGIVEKAEYNTINGNYIVLKHSDTLKTTYNHCNKLLVKEGERVKIGECIALVGATGYATGNHLHFEIIVNGKYINPLWVVSYDI